jgi:hypothetical protein
MRLLSSCRKVVSVILGPRYRPELHYMRGPGPKCLERQVGSSSQSEEKDVTNARTRMREDSAQGVHP